MGAYRPTERELTIVAALRGLPVESDTFEEVIRRSFAGGYLSLYSNMFTDELAETSEVAFKYLLHGNVQFQTSLEDRWGDPMPKIWAHLRHACNASYKRAQERWLDAYNQAEDPIKFAAANPDQIQVTKSDSIAGAIFDEVERVEVTPWEKATLDRAQWWFDNMTQYTVFAIWHICRDVALGHVKACLGSWMQDQCDQSPQMATHKALEEAVNNLGTFIDNDLPHQHELPFEGVGADAAAVSRWGSPTGGGRISLNL